MNTIVFTPEDLDRYVKLKIHEALVSAYLAARGEGVEDRFKKYGTSQMYWKGRSDAANDVRELKRRICDDANNDSSKTS